MPPIRPRPILPNRILVASPLSLSAPFDPRIKEKLDDLKLVEHVTDKYLVRGRKADWEQVGTGLDRPARECEDKFKELKSTGKRRKSTVQPVSTSAPLDKKTEKLEIAIAVCYASKDSVDWDTLAKDMGIPILRMLSWAKDTQSLFSGYRWLYWITQESGLTSGSREGRCLDRRGAWQNRKSNWKGNRC